MRDYNSSNIGSFKVNSGKLMVSDPCYAVGSWGQGIVEKVKNGKWNARVLTSNEGSWGKRVAVLIAAVDGFMPKYEAYDWEAQKFEVGVDSGQASIFDLAEFHSEDDNYNNPESFYAKCCACTLNTPESAGIVDNNGVVSSSGYGDGGYECKTITKNGEVVAVMVDYGLLQEDDEEPEDEEDEDEEQD